MQKVNVMRFFYFFLCLVGPLCAEELVIELASDSASQKPKTQNVYVAKISPKPTSYEESLYEVLLQDMQFNGYVNIHSFDEDKEIHAHHRDPLVGLQTRKWRSWQTDFVIILQKERSSLEIQVFDVSTAQLKTLHSIALTNNLDEDTRSIHKASDTICQITTKQKGIASKRILFSYQLKQEPENKGPWHADIWEMDHRGKCLKQVTEENHYSISPTFIPSEDKERYNFLYVTYKQGQPRIYKTHKGISRGKPFIPLRGNQLLPQVSKQCNKIAFISDAAGRADLFIQSFDPEKGALGKATQLYSFPGSVQASPTFDPEGKRIAFVSDKSGTPRVYIVHINDISDVNHKTPDIHLITRKNTDNSGPNWSPDGEKIVYSAKINGVRQIWIYDIKTEEERQITVGMENKENPCWASNNRHIVYNTTSPTTDIFLIDIEKREPIRLTEGTGVKHYPVFEP